MSKIVQSRGVVPLTRIPQQPQPHHPVVPAEQYRPVVPTTEHYPGGHIVERYYYIPAPAPSAPVIEPPTRPAGQPTKASTDMSFVIAIAIALIAFALGVAIFKEPIVAPAVSLGVVLVWLLNSLARFLRGE
jgi:hypothetical protein